MTEPVFWPAKVTSPRARRLSDMPPHRAVVAQAGRLRAERGERELQRADMVGTEAADLGIEVELAGRGREAAAQREGAIPALRNHLGVDGVQLPAGSPIVMQHGAAVDHGEMIRTVRDQREQGIAAVRRRRALIRGPVDLEDRPHQPDVADPDLAAQQGQGAQPKIDPVDPEPGPAASPIAAGDPGLRQGQGRGRQQAEV